MSDTRNSQRLRGSLSLVLGDLWQCSDSLRGSALIRDIYPEYLITLHCMIRASVPLMKCAKDVLESSGIDKEVVVPVADYLGTHILEEMNHDDWLIDDLESIGFVKSNVIGRMPSSRIASMVGAQYYWIKHHHPLSILGYISVMEGYPPTVEFVDELMARSGYPASAFRTLVRHAHLDPGHRDDLDALLDNLRIGPDVFRVIRTSALFSACSAASALREALESSSTPLDG